MLSIIVCYRNREDHLKAFVPHMRQFLKDIEHEIIIVEQNDNERFKRGCLLNEGVRIANGDVVVLHDVDYLPSDDVIYWHPRYNENTDVNRVVGKVKFINMDGTSRAEEDIPSGYRHFKDGVDKDFFGGVTAFKKSSFMKINGFNPVYDGWGLEDADLRERIQINNLTVGHFSENTFLALPHKDSFPGLHDEAFQKNQRRFAEWKTFLKHGINSTFCTTCEREDLAQTHGVDKWIQVTNFLSVENSEFLPFMSLKTIAEFYKDDPTVHTKIWTNFKAMVNSVFYLKNHRDWVVQNNWGYGNRAFHWMWNLLVKEAPQEFKFLEIGVFKGQTISLISLLNKLHNKNGKVYGITPLKNVDDKYSKHPDVDYEEYISTIYGTFNLDASDLSIIQGLSNEPHVIQSAESEGPYDLVYIDGGHDYETVVSDLENFGNLLKVGGYLIMDDASCNLNIPDGLIRMNWRGLPDVCKAVQDKLDTDERFEHCFAVGHNRVYKRIK